MIFYMNRITRIVPILLLWWNLSDAQPIGSPVAENGKLKVVGNQLVNQSGKPVQLKGMGSHGLQWFSKCYNESSINALAHDWGIDVFEIKINYGDYYAKDSVKARRYVDNLVELFTSLGVYVIIQNVEGASPLEWVNIVKNEYIYFCQKHKDKINVIYEPLNEPHDAGGSWENCKSFAQQVFPVLRNVIPDAIIIMATPSYCTQVNTVADDPLTGSLAHNVVYSFHIYAASHDDVMPRFNNVSDKIPMFAAEWGVCTYTGNGELDYEATDKWLDMWNGNNPGKQLVSWCNHNFAAGNGSSNALKENSCDLQQWNNVSPSGAFVKEKILESDSWSAIDNSQHGIIVFDKTNFQGAISKLIIGDYSTSQLAGNNITNNSISSIKVPYGYKVELFDGDNFSNTLGNLFSNESDLATKGWNDKVSSIRVTLANKPIAVENLTATGVSEKQIDLTWTDHAANETNYLIERSTGTGQLLTIATLPANSIRFSDSSLSSSTTYYYRVIAANSEGRTSSMTKSAKTLIKSGKTMTWFYSNTHFKGDSVCLAEGSYTTAQLIGKGIADNGVSSVKVAQGYTVEMFDGDNFTGTKHTLLLTNEDLVTAGFNDKMSSVIIKPQPLNNSLHLPKTENFDIRHINSKSRVILAVTVPEKMSGDVISFCTYTLQGKKVSEVSKIFKSGSHSIDITKMKLSGMYILEVKNRESKKVLLITCR